MSLSPLGLPHPLARGINFDHEKGVYYGVISGHTVTGEAYDDLFMGSLRTAEIEFLADFLGQLDEIVRVQTQHANPELLRAELSTLFHEFHLKGLTEECAQLIESELGSVTAGADPFEVALWIHARKTAAQALHHEHVRRVLRSCWDGILSDEIYDNLLDGAEHCDFLFVDDRYIVTDALDTDLLIMSSPYVTKARPCSLCIPEAGDLSTAPAPDGRPTYALGHEWFEHERAPYPIYDVETGAPVLPPEHDDG